jgi:hypothetical protein
MKTAAKRWSWTAWLARLESSALTVAQKATGRLFRKACGRGRGWIPAYLVDGAWESGNTVLSDMHAIRRQNLVIHNQGYFTPILGDPPPLPGAYRLPTGELKLLAWMLRENGGRGLYLINKHGYIDRQTDTAPWQLHVTFGTQAEIDRVAKSRPWVNPPKKIVNGLGERGLIERNGCGHGWPTQWTSEFRVATHRLYAVANLPDDLTRHKTE